ncbi:MAG: hypothetical protein KAJ20_03355 [Candidatus Aenigmarchaeota archaeon]|nr:hypothetical protein [Candidatus Aenigmarchaeota archaeon]MCK5042412.1 hypothetical protein [Candidatus Aenigmarchaeota archaeon]MCK5063374.1 hypothetical protein [Candidatus Aenigmarchaeota archaeon]MCK5373348.1 hypothetical protein [Candidatus Aenigmarchaeota archaeon]MCK5452331.1 hypothetical protein [Candidatus Aenigmarchaeota archaeon]
MVSDDNVGRLKKAIGIDFDHSHAPINNPLPSAAAMQNSGQPAPQPPIKTPKENIQLKSVLPPKENNPYPLPKQANFPEHIHPIKSPQAIPQPAQAVAPQPQSPPKSPIITQPEIRKESSALFVKIDRHVEITDEILGTRQEMRKMLETISLLSNAEKLKAEAVAKIEKRLNLFDEKLNKIDSNLVAPKEFSSPSVIPIDQNNAGLESLQSEITRLKSELDNL